MLAIHVIGTCDISLGPLWMTDADGHIEDEATNESRYLGQNSIAAFLSEEARAGETSIVGDQDVIKKDIMPILGLQISTAPYPFMSQDDMDKIRLQIASALPPNREVLKYVFHPPRCRPSLTKIYNRTFQLFKQIVQPFWGLLIDIEEFEIKLCTYLEDRAASAKHPGSEKGVSSAWLGKLFAVLAVATNYCELPYHRRVETSQSFGELPPFDFTSSHESANMRSPNVVPLPAAREFLPSAITRLAASSYDPRASSRK
jgi:hypothetical protein